MTTPTTPREVVDLDALAGTIADSLGEPTYCLDGQVGGGEGFVRFETVQTGVTGMRGPVQATVTATVSLVSDGEDEIAGVAGETFVITVRRLGA